MNDPEAEIKVSYDGEGWILNHGSRTVRLPRAFGVPDCVAAAAELSGLGQEWRKPVPGGELPLASRTPAPPSSGGAGEEIGTEERPGAAGEGSPPLAPFEAMMGIWTGLAKDEGGAALLGDLGVLLGRDGVNDPYGTIIQASSPGWREREEWRIRAGRGRAEAPGRGGRVRGMQPPGSALR